MVIKASRSTTHAQYKSKPADEKQKIPTNITLFKSNNHGFTADADFVTVREKG